ncbi:ANTH domain-containing protein [Lipomyces orientalis]|uniref:ANTH domain-containing protein n=1 Tax=Lipomyces orientalis TaxID=1233043 RepID=A0ACC3TTS6_9ASCO
MAAPKAKYIEPILQGTSNIADLEDIFRCLSPRLRDSAWTIVYKALVVVHIMIREGRKDVTLEYLSHHARMLDCSQMSSGAAAHYGDTIMRYSKYLQDRVRQYASTKLDYVRHKKDNPTQGRLRSLSVDKGLLREVESVQSQIRYLLRCRFLPNDVADDISLTAFRLLVHDLLALHQAVNEGVMNVLEHYFEMSKYDAERALEIYKTFVEEMEGIVEYLQVARKLESATRLNVPNIKHAPTSLTQALEEYLNDPDFDVNRRQFLAQKEAKMAAHRNDISVPDPIASAISQTDGSGRAGYQSQLQSQQVPSSPRKKLSPEQSLVDFFASIEQQESIFPDGTNGSAPAQQQAISAQQEMYAGAVQSPQSQPNQVHLDQQQFAYQPTGGVYPFQGQGAQQQTPLNRDFTGAGFGGYSYQPESQPFPTSLVMAQPMAGYAPGAQPGANGWGPFSESQLQQPSIFSQQQSLQPQTTGSTNPFRQSTMFTGISPQLSGGGPAVSTNPFHAAKPPSLGLSAVPEYGDTQQPQPTAPAPAKLVPQSTNPFARQRLETNGASGLGQRSAMSPQLQQPILTQQTTGSTNPFRQSQIR